MKLKCLKKDIETAVDTASRIVAQSATLPVLRCVVFDVQKDTVVLKATNLEIGIEKTFSVDVEKEGVVAVPAHTLLSTLKTSPSATTLTIEERDGTIVVTSGGAKTTIKTVPYEDFPSIPRPETAPAYKIQQTKLISGVRSVLYSASTSLIKPELASVYMYHEDDHLFFVATDSFRLAEKKIPHRVGEEDSDIPTVIMPAKNTTELMRILDTKTDEELIVFIDENQFSVQTDTLFITSRIIDGSFPDYRSILPKDTTTEAVLLKEDFANTLKKAHIFSDKFGQITLHVYPEKKTFTMSARNADVGEVFDSLEATLTGAELDISFNHRYVADCLQSIPTDSLTLSFAGVGKPLIITPVGDQSFTYLVMPMNR